MEEGRATYKRPVFFQAFFFRVHSRDSKFPCGYEYCTELITRTVVARNLVSDDMVGLAIAVPSPTRFH